MPTKLFKIQANRCTVLAYLLIISIIFASCIYKKNSEFIEKKNLRMRGPMSFIGKATIKIEDRGKALSSKMNYCYDENKKYFIADFKSHMNINLGYLVISKSEIFFYLSRIGSFMQADNNEENFSKIVGINIAPFSFINLLQGIFDGGGYELTEQITKDDTLFKYYRIDGKWLIEGINKKNSGLEALYFYKYGKQYAKINFFYSSKRANINEISIIILDNKMKISLKIEKQEQSLLGKCNEIELSSLMQGDAIDLKEYNESNPLIMDLLHD